MTFAAVRQAFRWEQALGRLDWDATRRVNLGHEACDRWAADRGRLALIWVAARALQTLVRERVGKHAWPREVEFVANLPRTESGKIQRALLRRRAVEEGAAMGRDEP